MGDRSPNWITCPWPEDYTDALAYQWEDVLIPYWRNAASFAMEHGVTKLAIEPHPGFCVYNPETLLRLRKEVGTCIGVNFDPSHLFWQGIDPVQAIEDLSGCLFHFHAKDSFVNRRISSRVGVLDPKPYTRYGERSWNFRTVGYGHESQVWKNMISALAMAGYDGTLSIEHEDALMPRTEGLEKAVRLLRELTIHGKVDKPWWELRSEG